MAKYVRKLSKDDSGYQYEEVKSDVKENDPGGDYVKAKIRENSVFKNAIADAKAVRNTALSNARMRMEDAFIPTGNDIIIQKEAVRRIKKLAGVKGRDLDDAVVHFNPEKNIYTIGDKKYTVECLSDIGESVILNQTDTTLNCDYVPSRGTSSPECVSGSISIINTDDSNYFKTASVDLNSFKSSSIASNYAQVREIGSHHSKIIVSE